MGVFGKSNQQSSQQNGATVIPYGTHLIGGIDTKGSIHIDGKFEGVIASASYITVGKTGEFYGKIEANCITVSGFVDGNIDCEEMNILSTGKVIGEAKVYEKILDDIAAICGQRPAITRAKKSISSFKVREGMKVGAKVTLRGGKMYEFLDRMISAALPRVRDFRGLNKKSIDKQGNLTVGIKEHIVFPEVSSDDIKNIFGFEVSVLARTRQELQAIIDDCPFSEEKMKDSYFMILHTIPEKNLIESVSHISYPNEEFSITNACIYFYCSIGYGNAKFNGNLFERKLKTPATTRNYKTMVKLLSLC